MPLPIFLPIQSDFFFVYLCFYVCFWVKAAPSNISRRRHAWSESDDDEPQQRQPHSSPNGELSAEVQLSDGEIGGDDDKLNADAAAAADEDE